MIRRLLVLSGLFGFSSVTLGAFGAHALKSHLASSLDRPQRLDWWHTATSYQFMHALALVAVAFLASLGARQPSKVAGVAFSIGIVLFSGSLYLMALSGVRTLGAITPLGGLSFLIGWASLIIGAWRLDPSLARFRTPLPQGEKMGCGVFFGLG